MGLEAAKRALRRVENDDLLVPYQTACEYLAGMEDPVAELQGLAASYTLVAPTAAHVLEVAQLVRRIGGRPRWGDVHIAAAAHLEGTYILTANPKDFAALGCRVWDYRNQAKAPE